MPANNLQTKQPSAKAAKPYKGMAMEGFIARWYTKIRKEDPGREQMIRHVRETVPAGGRILEIAPGPGYLAIELAKLGYTVVGLDISETFVQIAQDKAREAGIAVEFRHGNASDMPFDAGTFDFIICVAAFKNFTEPAQAIQEIYRVLKPGGKALISDLRRDASREEINTHIKALGLSRINAWITQLTFKHFLLKNAYSKADIRQLVSQTDFVKCDIREDPVGMEIWLEK
jgi:ubiquinone/menaquinone biosynthesis C-methylase UbiE